MKEKQINKQQQQQQLNAHLYKQISNNSGIWTICSVNVNEQKPKWICKLTTA